MNDDDRLLASWSGIVDSIVRGDGPRRPFVSLGPTPPLLQRLGLSPVDIAMTVGKIARCRREHPEVSLTIWRDLPRLLGKPLAVVPSARRDGSLVVVLIVSDAIGDPVLVPVIPGANGAPNMVLSVYGKAAGYAWIQAQIARAAADSSPHFVSRGFAATLPQPGSADAIPSSSGPIPVDGTTKPIRNVLKLPRMSRDEPDDDR